MEEYFLPILSCLGIVVVIWLQQYTERIAPYREPLISEDFYRGLQSSERMIVWILRNFDEGSRLYEIVQHIHTNYGIKQVVIVPDDAKISMKSEVPLLEFYQKTEIAVAIGQCTYIFSEQGVMESAVITAKRANKAAFMFVHDETSDSELRKVLLLYKEIYVFYTSKWTEDQHEWVNNATLQIHMPVFMKDFRTHTTQEKIVCFCKKSQWKFQRIAAELPTLQFFYSPTRNERLPVYTETAILCVLDATTPYEIVLEASASGIPVVVQWSPVYEEIFQEHCIYIKTEGIEEWVKIISHLKGNKLLYRQQSQKSLKMSLVYDSPRKMDMFLNCVFSGINNV